MRMFRGYLMLNIIALVAPAIAVIDRVTERIATFLLSMFAPEPLRLATDGPAFERRIDRAPLASSLLEGLRHEKGVRNQGAHRGI